MYFNKRDLKGHPDRVTISEHLTRYRQDLLNEAIRTVGKRNAWSKKCEIFVKIRGTIYPVWSKDELLQLYGSGRHDYRRRGHQSQNTNAVSDTVDTPASGQEMTQDGNSS